MDNLTRRFSYDAGGNLVRLDEIGYGENGERPERNTLFERDAIGRLLAKVNRDARQDFEYDEADRVLSIQRMPSSLGKQRCTCDSWSAGNVDANCHVLIRRRDKIRRSTTSTLTRLVLRWD